METSQVQNWMHYIRPDSGLSPQYGQDQSSNTLGRFPHTPVEHGIVASGSVWGDSGFSDELIEQQTEILRTLTGHSSAAARASSPRECSMNARDSGSGEAVLRSAVLGPCSDLADLSTPGTASAVTWVEEWSALDIASELTDAVNKVLCSSEPSNDESTGPLKSEGGISDELTTSSEHINSSNRPAELAISIPPARLVTHSPFPQVERPESSTPSLLPEFSEIPIPIFPFPAGTSRCKSRNFPIKNSPRARPLPSRRKTLHKRRLDFRLEQSATGGMVLV